MQKKVDIKLIIKKGERIAERQYYGQSVNLIEYDGSFYENYVLNETGEFIKCIACSDNNFDLFILANVKK
jgi:hypothetical protein